MSESRAQRQQALEERKRRIAELRQARTRRAEDTARVQASATANLDDFVTGLLNEPPPVSLETTPTLETALSEDVSVSEEVAAGQATSSAPPVVQQSALPATVRNVETFTIGTQTELEDIPAEIREEEDDDVKKDEAPKPPALEEHAELEHPPKHLSEEEIVLEVSGAPFSSFLNTASKKVERLLGSDWLLSDPMLDDVQEKPEQQQQQDARKFVSSQKVFECPKWTAGRDITDIDWSPLHRELVLCTYQNSSIGTNGNSSSAVISAAGRHVTPSDSLTPRSGELQSDGLVAVWSLVLPTRPEHLFTTGSPVTTGRFHPSDPHLVTAGCASGQVVVWDVRAGRLPVQKSAPVVGSVATNKGHSHAVNGMRVVDGGAGIVTSSTDGKVNFWSLSNLREPHESLQVGDSVSSFAVAPETGTLLFGDDNGNLYTAPTGQRRRQVRKLEVTAEEGHYGMVTAISTKTIKTAAGETALKGFLRGSGGLVLTSGVDWTVKLWAPAYRDTPLTSLVCHSYDYMSDVQWSPVHPSIFCTASSNGTLGLWNLGTSLEEPFTGQQGIVVDKDAGVNKIAWSLDGRRIATAVQDKLHIFTWTEEAIRSNKVEEDGKAMMNQIMARGWISNRQQ